MRYIETEKALKVVDDIMSDCKVLHKHRALNRNIKQIPTADVVEVRHGYWIEHIEKPGWLEDDVEVFYNCSECGTSHWSISPPYCPNCGAKMDGERSENGKS